MSLAVMSFEVRPSQGTPSHQTAKLVAATVLAALLCVMGGFEAALAAAAPSPAAPDRFSSYQLSSRPGEGVLVGGSSALAKAPTDTFFVYGGPGIYPGLPGFQPQGKFETAQGAPDRQGWIGVDASGTPSHWHVSTFNAPALPATSPAWWQGAWSVPSPNHAMWAGVEAGTPGYATAPGYGNLWDDRLDLRLPAPDPEHATTVQLGLLFNHDTEPDYDFFSVEWDSAGTFRTLVALDGNNRDGSNQFTTPVDLVRTVTYVAGEYVDGDIHLRLHFQSDGAWSDEDGQFRSDGAVQVDAIQVRANGTVISQTGFEGADTGGWLVVPGPFCGDFSKVLPMLTDLDPCRDDRTPQMTFIDNGLPPNNDPLHRSTGGSLSSTWSYGVPGGWVVNYTGGLSMGEERLNNEVWSPEIAWDLPGPADDGVNADGAELRFTSWQHLPFANGIVTVWHVRSRPDPDTGGWSPWRDRNFVYGYQATGWMRSTLFIRDLLVPQPTQVQIAFGVLDFADIWEVPGNDATPSPTYDNVALVKYNAATPTIVGREVDWFQDAFPQSGAIACTDLDDTPLAIRLDMARDLQPTFPNNVCGDSIIADFTVTTPGMTLDTLSVHLEFVLDANPCFVAERATGLAALQAGAAAGASDAQLIAPNKYRGFVRGRPSTAASGARVANRYFFDLPDGPVTLASYQSPEPALFFPGDRLRWFFAASTTGGTERSILPADTTGFSSGWHYALASCVAGLPTLHCTAGDEAACTQPQVLVWNDASDRANDDEIAWAFSQNGLGGYGMFDTYNTRAPSSMASNGLGSSGVHGATASQLAGYGFLMYDCSSLSTGLISDGSNSTGNDKGNDVGVLTAWFAQPANRYAAYFGDDLSAGLRGSGITYRSNVMGVNYVDSDLRSSIGNQTAPKVGPTAAGATRGFLQSFAAYGGCLAINVFDEIGPGPTNAVTTHEFKTPSGAGGVYSPSASVYYARQDTIAAQAYTRTNITFPYGFQFVWDPSGSPGNPGNRSARAMLMRELLIDAGHADLLDASVVAADPVARRRLTVAQNRPNPFNPITTIDFVAPARGVVSVRVYNLRGELVATLLDGVVEVGLRTVRWNGTDASGAPVASGIYVYSVEGFGQLQTRKMALIK